MAEDVKAIQIEIRWQRVVREEAGRKKNAYPWNLQLEHPQEKHSSLRSTFTKRSESTEAESSRSDSPEQTLHALRSKPGNGERRPPCLPRPKMKVDTRKDEKENICPITESIECRKSSPHAPLLTFRRNESLQPLGGQITPTQLPLKSQQSDSYDHLLGLCTDEQFSDMEELASTSGFLPKLLPEVPSEPLVYPETPEDEEISLTLDHFLDGVNRLKGDLRALQFAASTEKRR